MKKFYLKLLLILVCIVFLIQQMNAQVTTNSGSGLAATYTSLANAITALNAATISSPVVITLTGNETAPAGGYSITQLGGTATNTITIQGSSSTITAYTPQVSGNRLDAIFKIVGADYVTIENFTMQENSGNSTNTVASNTKTEFGVAIFYTTTTNGAQNITIQNNNISLSSTYQNAIGIYSTSQHSSTAYNTSAPATSTAGLNNGLKIYNNTISNVNYGIDITSVANTSSIVNSGVEIGSAAAGTGNTITYGLSTAADAGWSGFSTIISGIKYRHGSNSSIINNSVTSNSITQAVNGILINGTAPSSLTYTNTISNNTIILTETGTTTITGVDFGYGTTTGTIICNDNTITLNQTCTAASSAAVTAINTAYSSATSTINGNVITISQSTSSGSITSSVTGIKLVGSSITSTTITVGSSGTGNSITIKQSVSGTGSFGAGAVTFIDANSLPTSLSNLNINYNNLNTTGSLLRTTGSIFGINNIATTSTSLSINYNTINIDASGGTQGSSTGFHGIASGGGNNSGSTYSVSSNSITLVSTNTSSVNFTNRYGTSGIWCNDGSTNKIINGNNISISGSSTAVIGMYLDRGINNVGASGAGNTFTLSSSAVSPTIYGILVNTFAAATFNIKYNTINSITASDATTSSPVISVIKINTQSSNAATTNIANNVIYGVTTGASSGSATIRGIDIPTPTGTTTSSVNNIYNNKIVNLTASCTGGGSQIYYIYINGTALSSSKTNTIYNNIIGHNSAMTGVTNSTSDVVRGIHIGTILPSSNHYIYYNTINLNTSSTGANFGTCGIYHGTHTTSTTSNLDLRNNIIVNTSTPSGTGKTIAYRRGGTDLANYASTSNNNLFYAGTQGVNNLIFYDGTNSDQTLAAYQTRVSTRDNASISENPNWASTTGSDATYLHINTSTATTINGGGAGISGYASDYDGDTRLESGATDIGADEFSILMYATVTTGSASSISANGASLSGTVNANNESATGNFEYGLTTSYGSTSAWSPSPVTGATTTNVTATISGLQANTTYHYRIKANTLAGDVYGSDQTFTTAYDPYTFLGSTSSDWNLDVNWQGNTVPQAANNVYIISTAINQPHINITNAVCNNLTINSGASLTIDAGKALTVNGTLTNNAGNSGLLIKSEASLIHITPNVAATMEREISAANWNSTDEGWHVLSSPVVGQGVSGAFTPTGTNNDYDFYAWDEENYTWLNQKIGANNINTFGNAIGYLVAYQQAGNKTFAGNLNNADVNVTLSYVNTTANKKGWNLLGNPYPCALDWSNAAWNKSKIDGAKIWNSTTKNWVDMLLATTPNIIPANQGFIVKANSAGSFTIPAAARIHSGQGFYKSTSDMLILKAEKTGTTFNDVMGIDFNSSATLAFDTQKDAIEFETFGDAPSLYSVLSGGENVSINAVPAQLPASTVINLNFKARTNGQYSINATTIPSIPACATLLLEDSKTNVTHNLKLNPVYNFTATTTDNINRFKLHFQTFTGIEENENNSTLVYVENSNIIISSNLIIKSVEVYNEIGQRLSNYQVNRNNFEFSSNGKIQIIRIITDNGIIVHKLINL